MEPKGKEIVLIFGLIVENNKGYLLCIREKKFDSPLWKLPGGNSGVRVSELVALTQNKLWEETGVVIGKSRLRKRKTFVERGRHNGLLNVSIYEIQKLSLKEVDDLLPPGTIKTHTSSHGEEFDVSLLAVDDFFDKDVSLPTHRGYIKRLMKPSS